MGKGDRKTRKGKITKGTFGVRRVRKRSNVAAVIEERPRTKIATVKKTVEKKQLKKKKSLSS